MTLNAGKVISNKTAQSLGRPESQWNWWNEFLKIIWFWRGFDFYDPDFFLSGYLIQRIYVNNIYTIVQLQNNIRIKINAIPNDMLQRT